MLKKALVIETRAFGSDAKSVIELNKMITVAGK